MQHSDITYKGTVNGLAHLTQTSHQFVWRNPDKEEERYTVWLRYSNHCYSEAVPADAMQEDDVVVQEHPEHRVFCPIRFGETNRLVSIMSTMMGKPTTSVALTNHGNCHVFQLFVKDNANQRYSVFFSVKNSSVQPIDGSSHYLDVHVESAYLKDRRPGVRRTCPFGTVAYLTKGNLPYV